MSLTRVDQRGDPVAAAAFAPLSDGAKTDILERVGRREMTVADAARTIGCSTGHVYELRRRLAERGTLEPEPRRPRPRAINRAEVVAVALAHPLFGSRKIAAALRGRAEPVAVSASTISVILREAGLSTQRERIAAAETVE
ncbi:helix-turn-helix domain-containing protein [Actinoplanes sp. CA-142083]|uniref:helix-turn-helix domain-containing protein n=1 Tax=Actinoplanes sp. CA-142083 TaxID=3239903 RepID=UPI003D94963A